MGQISCPDCDGAVLSLEAGWTGRMNGDCHYCHGTGLRLEVGDAPGYLLSGNDKLLKCKYCSGTKQCQTCGGTGIKYVYEKENYKSREPKREKNHYRRRSSYYPKRDDYSYSPEDKLSKEEREFKHAKENLRGAAILTVVATCLCLFISLLDTSGLTSPIQRLFLSVGYLIEKLGIFMPILSFVMTSFRYLNKKAKYDEWQRNKEI